MKKNIRKDKNLNKDNFRKSLDFKNTISITKLKIFLAIIMLLFFLLMFRLFYLQIVDGNYLSGLATSQQTKSEVISSKRGNIYDATGTPLAISETVDTISINPQKITKPTGNEDTVAYKELVAKGLSEIFGLDYKDTLKKVNSKNSVETIAKKVEENKIKELKQWMKNNNITVGINIDEDSKRYYPNDTIASQVIGACGTDNQGMAGIEYSYDSILKGVSGQIVTSRDASKGEIPNSVESFVAAEDGYNLNLTIDIQIQRIVEKYIKKAVEDNNCEKGGNCIIMRPSTGEILGMASYPDYNLNDPYTPTSYYADNWDKLSSEERWKRIYNMWSVRSISEMYEPGSVFKLITAATALEENITTTDKTGDFTCNGIQVINGNTKAQDVKIKCWHYPSSHGKITLRQALMYSCNPALIQLGQRIGAKTLYKYYNAFGFFNKTNVGLSGEATGYFHNLDDIGPVELPTMSFGQRFTITPLQMVTALAAEVNGGYLMQPTLVKSMTNVDTGEVITTEPKSVRQVISSQTSDKIKDMMHSVVTDGTGKNAAVKGYTVGGKSGTSEPIAADKSAGYVASFAAISPVDDPQIVILVTLYKPTNTSHSGGTVSAPVVSNILSEVLPYLGIEPDNK